MPQDAHERRNSDVRSSGCPYLTEAQIDDIVDKAVAKAAFTASKETAKIAVELLMSQWHQEIGKLTVKLIATVVIVMVAMLAGWLQSKGFFIDVN